MIKAILFDCFGVLVVDGWLPFKDKHFSHSKELLKQAGRLNEEANSGRIGYDEFIKQIAKLAGINAAQVKQEIENNPPNQALFTYIKELKKSYKIGFFSNSAADWMDELFTPEQVKLFDEVYLSYQTGLIKPNPQAYLDMARKLNILPNEAVMIDDQARFASGAQAVGMNFIVYKDFQQFKTELEAFLKKQ